MRIFMVYRVVKYPVEKKAIKAYESIDVCVALYEHEQDARARCKQNPELNYQMWNLQ